MDNYDGFDFGVTLREIREGLATLSSKDQQPAVYALMQEFDRLHYRIHFGSPRMTPDLLVYAADLVLRARSVLPQRVFDPEKGWT